MRGSTQFHAKRPGPEALVVEEAPYPHTAEKRRGDPVCTRARVHARRAFTGRVPGRNRGPGGTSGPR